MIPPELFQIYLIVLPLVFLAGIVDSIAGGGGLLTVPAYMAAGLPPHYVLGTNKFSSMFGTLFSTARYLKHGLIDVRIAVLSAVFALVGSFSGSRTVLVLDPGFLRYILLVMLPVVTVLYLMNRKLGHENHSGKISRRKRIQLAMLAGFVVGFYDGFFGPGTGSFLILFYTVMLKYDFITANANTKVVNLASNVAALISFLIAGKVLFYVGIPAMVAGVSGNVVGSSFVLKKGGRVIRPVFIAVLALLFVKIAWDTFRGGV